MPPPAAHKQSGQPSGHVPASLGAVHIGPRDGPAVCTSQQSIPVPHAGEQGGGAHLSPSQKSLGALHRTPHAPQLWMSFRRLTQAPSQQVKPMVHNTAQALPPASPTWARSAGAPPSPSVGNDAVRQAATSVSTTSSVRIPQAYSLVTPKTTMNAGTPMRAARQDNHVAGAAASRQWPSAPSAAAQSDTEIVGHRRRRKARLRRHEREGGQPATAPLANAMCRARRATCSREVP